MAFSGVRGGNFGGIFELDGCKVTAAPSPSPLLPLVTLDILGAAADAASFLAVHSEIISDTQSYNHQEERLTRSSSRLVILLEKKPISA